MLPIQTRSSEECFPVYLSCTKELTLNMPCGSPWGDGKMCLFRPRGQNKESVSLKSVLATQWVRLSALQDGWLEVNCISGKEGVSKGITQGRCYLGSIAHLAASSLDRSVWVFSPRPILLFIYIPEDGSAWEFCNIQGFPEVFNSLVFKSLPLEQNVPET